MTNELPEYYDENVQQQQSQMDDLGWSSYFGANGNNDDDDIRWKNYRENNCSWLFGCEYQAHTQAEAPRWWIGSDETSESSPPLRAALSLVYVGSSMIFGVIIFFGHQAALLWSLEKSEILDPLLPVLVAFSMFSFLILVLIGCVGGMVKGK